MIMRKIKLTKGKFALVDDEDFEYLNQWKWCFSEGYAVRSEYHHVHGLNHRVQKLIRMHRVINSTPKNLQTDHINGDGLDNRRSNLRNVTKLINSRNRHHQKNNKSGCIGVFYTNYGKYVAYVTRNRKRQHLGSFDTLQQASIARKLAA